mmetsp:Transcript_3701/g.10494  ORF Transcript_3701/g.10494 Transcript_3701/m.10494 type:complete len:249 (-) Transcript_3701:1759-2505(-)
MAPQSDNTVLDSFFGSRRDFLCTNGGSFGGVDHQPYRCPQYQYPCQQYKCYQYPTAPSMPSCAKENNVDLRSIDFQCKGLQGMTTLAPKIPPCSQTPQNMPSMTQEKVQGRRVTFLEQDHIEKIPHLSDYTREELGELYLTRDEMNRSHEECWRLVDLMNSGIEYEDHEQFSKRGLIDLKDDSVERRRKIRDHTYQIVLGVQSFHASKSAPSCMDIVEITAGLYRKAAEQAREEALEAAWFDAVAVRM